MDLDGLHDGQFCGIVTSGLSIKFLGIGRYLVVSATTFAVTALACATAPDLQVMIALRTIQGFAAGGFGPAAFVAVFMVTGGPHLPFGVTLLAFVLLFPGSLGPVIAGFVEDSLGWQTLFLIQAGIGAILALAAHAWAPHQESPDLSALKTDWIALTLLSIALATLTLLLSQGTRRFWFENETILWCTAASIAAWAGFAFLAAVLTIADHVAPAAGHAKIRHPDRTQLGVSRQPSHNRVSRSTVPCGHSRLSALGDR